MQTVTVQPDAPFHEIEGVKHLLTAGRRPGIYDPALADLTLEVTTEESQRMPLRLAREEGLFVGISSGANIFAAVKLRQRQTAKAVIVTVLCESGGRYLSDSYPGRGDFMVKRKPNV